MIMPTKDKEERMNEKKKINVHFTCFSLGSRHGIRVRKR